MNRSSRLDWAGLGWDHDHTMVESNHIILLLVPVFDKLLDFALTNHEPRRTRTCMDVEGE
jgi:hypothetical protein